MRYTFFLNYKRKLLFSKNLHFKLINYEICLDISTVPCNVVKIQTSLALGYNSEIVKVKDSSQYFSIVPAPSASQPCTPHRSTRIIYACNCPLISCNQPSLWRLSPHSLLCQIVLCRSKTFECSSAWSLSTHHSCPWFLCFIWLLVII